MAKHKLYLYAIKLYSSERDAAGNAKTKVVHVKSAFPETAIRNAMDSIMKQGVKGSVVQAKIINEPIPLSELKKAKPPMHKKSAYYALYNGAQFECYVHKESGARLTREEWRELPE
jgi:hypothetical protein